MTYEKQGKQWQKKGKFPGKLSRKNSNSNHSKYKINFKPAANRGLRILEKPDQQLIKTKIDKLVDDPYPDGVKKLSGSDNIFRLRIRNFRILYTVVKRKLIILILKIGNRKDIYKKR